MDSNRPSLGGFPSTRRSIIAAVCDDDPDARRTAFDALVSVYWRPVYTRLRLRWGTQPADAEDLTQEFFARALEREFFGGYDPARARFRTYLRVCLDHFAANARRAERRLRRGGGATMLPLEAAAAERDLAAAEEAPSTDPDTWFDREWVRSLFDVSVAALRQETAGTAREIRYRVFERHDLGPPPGGGRPGYRAVAEELGLTVSQVTNHLAWARRELRRLVLERLALLCGSDAELREEARTLFGEVP
ncbi:MAG TPA: sigma factor [Gemmatimonadales bacterium]